MARRDLRSFAAHTQSLDTEKLILRYAENLAARLCGVRLRPEENRQLARDTCELRRRGYIEAREVRMARCAARDLNWPDRRPLRRLAL
jgi:hypothetical protein